MMNPQTIQRIMTFQKDEITSYTLYLKLAKVIKDSNNAKVIQEMALTELRHYQFWKEISKTDVRPNRVKIFLYMLMVRLLGLTFSIKMIEKAEVVGAQEYAEFEAIVPGAAQIGRDEEEHEESLTAMIEEEFLQYVGSIVLGLNDALVELTGTLAGLTLALRNGKLVAISGLITGIAAAFSMAASNFLSERAEENTKAGKAALYTGAAYLITVIVLILPYFFISPGGQGIFVSLGVTLLMAVLIILAFNFFISVAKDLPFRHHFLEMLIISMSVTFFSFLVGLLVRNVFKIDV
jgi:VIT1/CCC1 family predicted Fe2+/Mn2+ transporter